MTLTSMPPTPGNSSDVLALHHSLISTFSHLFVMKMDWIQGMLVLVQLPIKQNVMMEEM